MRTKLFLLFYIFVSSINFYEYFLSNYSEKLTNIIDNFNYNALYISKEYEYICLDLMKEVYDKNLLVLDTLYLTKKTDTTHINKYIYNNKLWPSIANIISSGTKSIIFPNSIYFAETFFFTTELLSSYAYDLFQDNTNLNKNILQIRDLNNKLYSLTNIYCLNTFYIHVDVIDNNYLIIYGDNIDYSWIIYLLQTLETNIQEILDNKKKIKYTYIINYDKDELISLYERLIKLRNIIQEIQIIINYSFDKMSYKAIDLKLNWKAIKYIKDYLNEIIIRMNTMLINVQKLFPIQENEKQKKIELLKQKKLLYDLDYNITHLQNFIKEDNWNKYLSDIHIFFINTCNKYSKTIEIFIQELANIVISPIFIIIRSIGIQLNKLISLMIFSKNGLTIICFIILVCNLANIIRLVMHIIIYFSRKFIFE